jgi:hypothetical protein
MTTPAPWSKRAWASPPTSTSRWPPPPCARSGCAPRPTGPTRPASCAAGQQLEQARRAGSELLDRIRELIAKPGPVDGWKREVGALAAQGEAEATRLRGGQEPDAWAAAVAAWERLGMPYPAAYCRWRQAEALLDGGGATRGRAHRLLGAAHAAAVALGAAPLRDGILWTWIPYPGIVTGPDRKGGP